MKNTLIAFGLLLSSISLHAQSDGWAFFAKTKFETKFNEKAAEYFMMPVFPAELKALIGKEVSLEGYYMPIDVEGNAYIILSKFPYSQCFFCGGAGPETIAEVYFKVKPSKFEADQFIRVKGKVKLNETDLEHGNFILTDATLIEK
ncbi:MAG: hypothetical protein IM606_07210 [Cytophagales bacterium]|jgi:hypothetical protein|nr:hypothetical protein [Cytophagales bacterium]MCA6387710.1 hypothetical protein [Cytophagales bacterium]MCA6393345.1 hypothetical protein [Cytophagales bacterium]MCA6394962.1 hypothetical protein [Cytophagales bacterium]MCA6398790.1 hypothetical protein [Cytophagales bacterium]